MNFFKQKNKKREHHKTSERGSATESRPSHRGPRGERAEGARSEGSAPRSYTPEGGRGRGGSPGRSRNRNRRRSNGGPGGNSRRSGQKPQPQRPRRPEVFNAEHYADRPRPQGAFQMLSEELRQALIVQGYVAPTPVQQQSIPPILDGHDLIGSAQTGTGKTAAFILPVLDLLTGITQKERELGLRPAYKPAAPGRPRALILAPTRELADQIGTCLGEYGRFLPLTYSIVYGGVSQYNQVRDLRQGVDILVATPGRLLDLVGQEEVDFSDIEIFILDEVDRMLDMGFIPDIRRIMETVPESRQTLFFSATVSRKIKELARDMVRNPVEVQIEPDQIAVDRIRQSVYFVGAQDKASLLVDLLKNSSPVKAIVFTQMKHAANQLTEKLEKAGVSATAIHGNKTQAARTKALEGFKRGSFQVLVATDVAARGLDVDDVTHVINYDLPMEAETYVHRIGRTARAGAEGDALSFCSAEDRALLHAIEKHTRTEVPVILDHDYHCHTAQNSRLPAPVYGGKKNWGGGKRGGKRGGSRGERGRSRRFRN